VQSAPVTLKYDLAAASNDGTQSVGGFDNKGTRCRRRCCRRRSLSTMCNSNLLRRRPACAMRLWPRDKRLIFQPATITACSSGGFRGWRPEGYIRSRWQECRTEYSGLGRIRWPVDDRQWSSKDTSHDDYGEMMGIKPGYIKRADVAWYCSHHHTGRGANVAYRILICSHIRSTCRRVRRASNCPTTTRSEFWRYQ